MTGFSMFPEQHPGQANFVFDGYLDRQHVVTRLPRRDHGAVAPFYDGVSSLFGSVYANAYHYRNVAQMLRVHSPLFVPELITCYPWNDGRFMPTHRYVEGRAASSYDELTESGSRAYGRFLATLHGGVSTTGFGCYGNVKGAGSWWPTVRTTIQHLLNRYDHDDATYTEARSVTECIQHLPEPARFAPIMLDLDPSQYFITNGHFCVLIDIDFYVFGPPELELIALESMYPGRLATSFRRGYESLRPFPDLSTVRRVYRLLNRLLRVRGDLPYREWHDAPALFQTLSR
ncbi:protein kinase family protein [Alicyclobacillus dauci]|uniref:Phosphotransferase enzyme family protein n=1 Tax=Alicyclobacillus dauci TaxID=1475485 RepID=A0ABY6Z2L2_9BACL|nr:hypothetical protein [Alicyclobacillus dauci]WAH36922.1 hypothetical protein NZD86_22630 [Alicyclobacillus dauci]